MSQDNVLTCLGVRGTSINNKGAMRAHDGSLQPVSAGGTHEQCRNATKTCFGALSTWCVNTREVRMHGESMQPVSVGNADVMRPSERHRSNSGNVAHELTAVVTESINLHENAMSKRTIHMSDNGQQWICSSKASTGWDGAN